MTTTTEEKTYLELSQEGGSAHKFYEVTLNGSELTIRFGRIGDKGQVKTSKFDTPQKAQAQAEKKIKEKVREGYEKAVMGVRKKRAVTNRAAAIAAMTQAAPARKGVRYVPDKQAPVLWNFASGSTAFGIWVDEHLCWVGNQKGQVFALDHEGKVHNSYQLPEGVKCLMADGPWIYAGCDDGNVYDLSGKVPRLAYRIDEKVDIYWLDIHDSVLAVSDDKGGVTVINHEDESQWSQKSGGYGGWMVRCDEIGVYLGASNGVTMYDWEDGRQIWQRKTGTVLFGWQEEDTVYAGCGDGKIYAFSKKGEPGTIYQCDSTVISCAASPGGRYVFGADGMGGIYCFDRDGTRLWKLASGCGGALSMQYHQERLYIVTGNGSFACIDASEVAIKAAQEGSVPQAVALQAPAVQAVASNTLETTRQAGQGVVVECYKEGGELRVRVVSDGFNRKWHCQFPKDIREEGARYVVDQVRESSKGGFYRALGNIRKLIS